MTSSPPCCRGPLFDCCPAAGGASQERGPEPGLGRCEHGAPLTALRIGSVLPIRPAEGGGTRRPWRLRDPCRLAPHPTGSLPSGTPNHASAPYPEHMAPWPKQPATVQVAVPPVSAGSRARGRAPPGPGRAAWAAHRTGAARSASAAALYDIQLAGADSRDGGGGEGRGVPTSLAPRGVTPNHRPWARQGAPNGRPATGSPAGGRPAGGGGCGLGPVPVGGPVPWKRCVSSPRPRGNRPGLPSTDAAGLLP